MKLHKDISKLYDSSKAKLRNCYKVLKYHYEVFSNATRQSQVVFELFCPKKILLWRGIYIFSSMYKNTAPHWKQRGIVLVIKTLSMITPLIQQLLNMIRLCGYYLFKQST